MYSPDYDYGSGNAFNLNAPSPSQVQAQAYATQQHQYQQQRQTEQHPSQKSTYASHQYSDPIGPSQLSPYVPIGAAMSGNAGPVGIGPNNGMAHISAGNGTLHKESSFHGSSQPQFNHSLLERTPYSSSPYNGNISTSSGSLVPNYMSASNATPAYAINVAKTNLPLPNPRVQPSLSSANPSQSGSKPLAFIGGQQNTPSNSITIQPQFSTRPNTKQHLPSPINTQQTQSASIATPQRHHFQVGPQNTNTGSPSTTPISPVPEAQERERVTTLLNINKELLLELMRLQADHNEFREDASSTTSDGVEKEKFKTPITSRYYYETDRNKPLNQIPPHPQFMTAPTPTSNLTHLNITANTSPNSERRNDEERDPAGESDRTEILREYYRKLQALFPGVVPRKDPFPNPAVRAQQAAAHHQALKQSAMEQNIQQHKTQNDLLRQQMMQAQQNMQTPQRYHPLLELNQQQLQR